MSKFCFVCGKKTDDLKEGRCKKCYTKDVKLIEVPKRIVVNRCGKCGAVRMRDKWKEAGIKNAILNEVKILEKDVKLEITGEEPFFTVIASNKKDEEHAVEVAIKKSVCDVCARKYTQYYEAVIQVRGNFNDKILDYITGQLTMAERKDRRAFYYFCDSNIGVDIRVGSKAAAWHVAETLKKKFDCRIIRSSRLMGKKKGSEIYRECISLRFE